MPHSQPNPFLQQNQPPRESIFCDKVGGWWVKRALFVLIFLLKSGQMVGSWVAKPISIWRGKLVGVGLSRFASWPRFAGYSRFAGCARLASCARFTSYSRFTSFSRFTRFSRFSRFSSYTSPTSPARLSPGTAIFSVNKLTSLQACRRSHLFTFSPFHPFTFLC